MCVGKRLHWLLAFSMFAIQAVQAARPPRINIVAAAAKQTHKAWSRKCENFGAENMKRKWTQWFHRQRCHCPVEHYPSKGCGQIHESQQTSTFLLRAANPETCGCIDSVEKSAEISGRECYHFEGTKAASNLRLPHWDMFRRRRCYCPPGDFPSEDCGTFDEVRGLRFPTHSRLYHQWPNRTDKYRSFRLAAANQDCKCLAPVRKSQERSALVKAAAVQFCTAVVLATGTHLRGVKLEKWSELRFIRDNLKLTPQLCQEVLTGTLRNSSASQESQNLFGEANGVSEHEGAKGFGHLDALFTGAPPSYEGHKTMLHRVCKDECEELVNETMEKIHKMLAHDVREKYLPVEEICADRVVRKVEAEVLGCCGRACGWNNRSCTSWPFFTKDEKVNWLEECCGEYNILQNSSREVMCDSVFTRKQAELASKNSTKARRVTDMGGSYMGQDPPLLWTIQGLKHFSGQLKELKIEPQAEEQVTSEFQETNPEIRQEGIQRQWFKEEKIAEKKKGPTSVAQTGASLCDSEALKFDQCPPETKRQIVETCLRGRAGWQYSKLPDTDDIDDENDCLSRSKGTPVPTPDACLQLNFGVAPDQIKRRFFLYQNTAPAQGIGFEVIIPDEPILCFFDPQPENQEMKGCEFERKPLTVEQFNSFEDHIYWIEEKAAEDRREQIRKEQMLKT